MSGPYLRGNEYLGGNHDEYAGIEVMGKDGIVYVSKSYRYTRISC